MFKNITKSSFLTKKLINFSLFSTKILFSDALPDSVVNKLS